MRSGSPRFVRGGGGSSFGFSSMSDEGSGQRPIRNAAPDAADDPTQGAAGDARGDAALEPLTLSLLGRFFGIPLLVISILVTGAVLVVFLFGGPATERTRSVESLLQTLEASSGEKSMGLLLPREKELWQAALELAQRLSHKGTELSSEELETVSARLTTMIQRDRETLERISGDRTAVNNQRLIRANRLRFLIHALGRTETASGIETLIDIIRRGEEPLAAAAIQELGERSRLKGDAVAVEVVTAALKNSERIETQLIACTVLSVLALPGDASVIEALAEARLRYEGEVGWSASLALARLGSHLGKSTLLDLLDRKFLQSPDLYVATDEEGRILGRYPLPPERIEATLIAAIDAASKLSDADLWESIEKLESDPSLAVRGKAAEVLADRT